MCLHSFEHMVANTWVFQQSSISLQLQKELQVVVSHLDMVAGAQSPFLWRSRILLSTAQLSLQSLVHTFVRNLRSQLTLRIILSLQNCLNGFVYVILRRHLSKQFIMALLIVFDECFP